MLKVQDIQKRYGTHQAVKPLSFTLEKGQVLGLLGRNGAGKSTTIKMLLGLIPTDGGSVMWEGKPFQRKNLSIGYLPEERGLYDKTSVYDQLLFFGQLEGMSKKQAESSIDQWLERFEIPSYKRKLVSELSKGNKQKIQLIATLLHDPELIVLDEPFSGLDPVNANAFSDVISELIAAKKTLILSSHRMEQIETFCHDIIMLKEGEVKLQGNWDDIKASYGARHVWVRTTDDITSWLQARDYSFTSKEEGQLVDIHGDEQAVQLFHLLKESGFAVREFSMKEPSLHDLFVERVK